MNLKVYDHIIVGGGFAGTAIAYQLARRGSNVLLLEARNMCSGTSGACAGRVQLIESETQDYLKLVWDGFKRVEGLFEELDCDLEWETPGHLTLLRNDRDWSNYTELVGRLTFEGIPAEMIDLKTLQNEEPLLSTGKLIGAAYSCEGHVNPFKFFSGFLGAAKRFGAEMMPFCAVTGFEKNRNSLAAVVTQHGRFTAGNYIFTTGAWTAQIMALAGVKFPMGSTRAEAMVSEALPKMLNHHIGVPGFYEAVHAQDHHSTKLSDRNVSLGVGQHRNGTFIVSNAIEQSDEINLSSSMWGLPSLSDALLEYFPKLRRVRIVRTWTAPSPFMPDYLPAVGKIPGFENLFVAVGFHLSIPTIPILSDDFARMLLEDDISLYLREFDPSRFFVNDNF